MNVEDLIGQFREDADDLVAPYLWDAAWVTRWLDEAQREAAVRARLIYEDSDPAITQIAVTVGQANYTLHKSIYELAHLKFLAAGEMQADTIVIKNREELDRIQPNWRDKTDDPRIHWAIQDDKRLTLVYKPQVAGTLYIEGYRLPLTKLDDDDDTPEINEVHHRHLVQWALHRAFSKPDSETVDPKRAELAKLEFTGYFGEMPDAGLRRESRADQPQHNVAW